MGRDADRELADTADQVDEIDRVLELARGQVEVLGWVATQREHVLDARAAVARHDLLELARVCAAHVRCAIAVIPVSRLIRVTMSCVRSRVVPPAPYVTDTYEGASGSSSWSVRSSVASASSVFGGKNSNEMLRPCRRMSLILTTSERA